MPLSFVQWIALIGIVAIALVFLSEVRKWRSLALVIHRKHRALRTLLLVLIEALFVLMFIGPWITGGKNALVEISYWMICLGLGVVVVVLAMIDLRAVAQGYASASRQVFGKREEDDWQ